MLEKLAIELTAERTMIITNPPEEIAKEFVTKALVDKVYAKIENDTGFSSKSIPRLLNTVFYDVVKEDCWNFIKKHKNPTINFKTLQYLVYQEVKLKLPKVF